MTLPKRNWPSAENGGRNGEGPVLATLSFPTNLPQYYPGESATSEGKEITQFRVSPQEKIGPPSRKIDL